MKGDRRFFVIISNNRGNPPALFPMVDHEEPSILVTFPTREAAREAAARNPLAQAAGAEVFEYGEGEFV
jgi:hypothetical protein